MNIPNPLIPHEATHPGYLIKDEIDARPELTQAELAKQLGVKRSFLNEVIKGKRNITADLAILLEKVLAISADFWMRFQSQYEIDCARIKERNIIQAKNIEIWTIIKELVPVNYFRKLGYLTDDLTKDVKTVFTVFSVENTDALKASFSHCQNAYYRKSEKLKINDLNIFAWSSLAKHEAAIQKVGIFDFDNMDALCTELNELFYTNENTLERVKQSLNAYGIKMVYIEKLEGTPVDGFSFWSGNNPAIAMTLRHKRIDNFAFTLMHELAHISLHLRNDKDKPFLDFNKKAGQSTLDCEREADAFAQEKLLPNNCASPIVAYFRKIPYFIDDITLDFSKRYRIHPAIILGQVCYTLGYFAYKTKIDKSLY